MDASVSDLTAERVGRNDATFRDANEKIRAKAEAAGMRSERVPFICECAEPTCTSVIQMSLEEYEEIRAGSRDFLNVPGHEAAARGWGEVIDGNDRYVVVRKLGRAGEVAEALDERRDEDVAV